MKDRQSRKRRFSVFCNFIWWMSVMPFFWHLFKKTFSTLFFKYFLCDLPLLAVFIIFDLFCHQVVYFIHLVYRQTRELNSRPRTMAQIVSPRCSPLDQGASPNSQHFFYLCSWKKLLSKCINKTRCYTEYMLRAEHFYSNKKA